MTIFDETRLENIDFESANLKYTRFIRNTWKNLKFTNSNLRLADFSTLNISTINFDDALSIHDAKLPNGLYGQDKNLIRNASKLCNSSMLNVSQSIYLEPIWNRELWSRSKAMFNGNVSRGVSVDLMAVAKNRSMLNKVTIGMIDSQNVNPYGTHHFQTSL